MNVFTLFLPPPKRFSHGMEPLEREQLIRDLIRDEGSCLKPYQCSAGKLTIGVGRNLEDRGISEDEAGYLLKNDIAGVLDDLDRNIPWWRGLDRKQRLALANMGFNLGWPRLSRFKNMLAALKDGDVDTAAREALNSRWAEQVGARAKRIADQLKGN